MSLNQDFEKLIKDYKPKDYTQDSFRTRSSRSKPHQTSTSSERLSSQYQKPSAALPLAAGPSAAGSSGVLKDLEQEAIHKSTTSFKNTSRSIHSKAPEKGDINLLKSSRQKRPDLNTNPNMSRSKDKEKEWVESWKMEERNEFRNAPKVQEALYEGYGVEGEMEMERKLKEKEKCSKWNMSDAAYLERAQGLLMYYEDRNLNNKREEEDIVRERQRMYEERESHRKFEREREKKRRADNALYAKHGLKNQNIGEKEPLQVLLTEEDHPNTEIHETHIASIRLQNILHNQE